MFARALGSRTDSRLCTKSKAAADAAVWIARPNVMTELRPRRLHGMPGMVPWKGRFRFVALVIERQIAFDFFVQLSRVFYGNLRNQCDTLLRNPRRDAPFLHTAASRDIRANIFLLQLLDS